MKNSYILIVVSVILYSSCKNAIKNENAKVTVEDGTKIDNSNSSPHNNLLGNYVGIFEPDYSNEPLENIDAAEKNNINAGESFRWKRENKISLSIDEIKDTAIKGHSVVAGNERPFVGNIIKTSNGLMVMAKEPGDKKEDGIFTFEIKDTLIKGTWKSYTKINIENRKYELYKKPFSYNANVILDTTKYGYPSNRYIDWTKPSMSKAEIKALKAKMTKEEIEVYEEFEENTDFASATEIIYRINSSTTLLKEDDVANLKRGDIYILRNIIYARHGYSFKYAPLRVFFDKQSWYIPASINIKNQFSDIEKKNIELLLRYEKSAKEYYDTFGRQ